MARRGGGDFAPRCAMACFALFSPLSFRSPDLFIALVGLQRAPKRIVHFKDSNFTINAGEKPGEQKQLVLTVRRFLVAVALKNPGALSSPTMSVQTV